jgi:hypothetical protein
MPLFEADRPHKFRCISLHFVAFRCIRGGCGATMQRNQQRRQQQHDRRIRLSLQGKTKGTQLISRPNQKDPRKGSGRKTKQGDRGHSGFFSTERDFRIRGGEAGFANALIGLPLGGLIGGIARSIEMLGPMLGGSEVKRGHRRFELGILAGANLRYPLFRCPLSVYNLRCPPVLFAIVISSGSGVPPPVAFPR